MSKARITIVFDTTLEDGESLEKALQNHNEWLGKMNSEFMDNYKVTGVLIESPTSNESAGQ